MWTTKFIQDTDVPGVGTLTAVSPDVTFFVSERVDTNDPVAVAEFVAKAKADFASKADKKTNEEAIAEAVAVALNKL